MRRKRMAPFHPLSRRSGVTASVMHTNRSVQIPVSLVMSLSGSGLRCPVSAAHTSQASGARLATNTIGLRTKRTVLSDGGMPNPKIPGPSEVLAEIHARVQAFHLIAVAVEQERLAPEDPVADPLLGGLAPARVVDAGVHVRVEAVFL